MWCVNPLTQPSNYPIKHLQAHCKNIKHLFFSVYLIRGPATTSANSIVSKFFNKINTEKTLVQKILAFVYLGIVPDNPIAFVQFQPPKLGSNVTLYQCLMPDYAHRCRTSTLMMVPINFWRNSDPLKKRNIF